MTTPSHQGPPATGRPDAAEADASDTATGIGRELAREQAAVDHAYLRLEHMRRAAIDVVRHHRMLGEVRSSQSRVEWESLLALTDQRLQHLEIGDAPLCFGRVDRHGGETYQIGRLSILDEGGDPLVVDWRAPAAEAFYRATGRNPMDLIRRRHLLTKGHTIVGLDDEVFDLSGAEDGKLEIVGEGALLAALDRSRTGRMSDIVATIQAEQDVIIRAPFPGILIVTGGPGTGKTAVALHRAAYLIYTNRQRLEEAGVLVIGPNRTFLRYIEQVLPSLGESGVELSTVDGLYRRAVAKRFEPVEMEHLKGDVRMVAVIHKAVLDRERGLGRDLVVPYGTHRLRITQGDLDRLVEQTRQKRGNHNVRRAVIARRIRQALWAQQRRIVERRLERATPVTFEHDAAELGFELDTQETAAATLNEEQNRFLDNIGAIPELREALERIWPLLTAEELLHDLFGAPSLLRLATRHVLTEDEGKLLTRQRSASVADVAWSAADLALLDEAHRILGPLPTKTKRRRTQLREAAHWMIEETVEDIALQTGELDEEMRRQLITRLTEREQSFLHEDVEDSEPTAYGHIIVDEAQDISAMQWRMITRRNPGGSMTIVGDLGQASRPGAIASWHQALAQLPARREPRLLELTVNYRTPAELMEVAARVLAVTDPMLIPPRSVRQSGAAPLFARVSDTSALALEVADQVSRLRSEVQEGRVAVIAPPAMVPAIQDALVQRGQLDTGDGSTVLALEHPVAVFTPLQAKGLEFDAVVLVEPSELAGGTLAGLRGLYVGLTRATRFLAVVYCADLPDPLATLVSGSQ